jgi:cadmium resistance protein CadD (predicted permease)
MNDLVGERLGRYGRLALPFVLIALGLWILADARSLLVS